MKFTVNEKVKIRAVDGSTILGTVVDIHQQYRNLDDSIYYYSVRLENCKVLTSIPEHTLVKMIKSSQVSAMSILKDKSGGQMAVSILAVQKILSLFQKAVKRNKVLEVEVTELRTKSINQNETIIQLNEQIAKLKQENDLLGKLKVKLPLNYNNIIVDDIVIDFDSLSDDDLEELRLRGC